MPPSRPFERHQGDAGYATANNFYIFLACLVSLTIGYLSAGYIGDRPLDPDASQNVRIAYHLVHTGVWGYDEVETPKPRPQIKREPLPILVNAVLMILDPAFEEPFKIKDVTQGHLLDEIKKVNIFWAALLSLAIFLLVGEMCRSTATAIVISVATVALTFTTMMYSYLDKLMTEIPAAMLMLLGSWLGLRFVRDRSRFNAILLGLALGLLTLVKASFLYIGMGYIILLFLIQPPIANGEQTRRLSRRNLQRYGVIALAMLLTITPWLLRNTITFGAPVVTARGGDVLALRALLSEQPLSDWLYYFSPASLQPAVSAVVDHPTLEELTERYGYIKSNRWKIYRERMDAADHAYRGKFRSEPWLTRETLKYFAENPGRYVLSTFLFAYRGTWFLDESFFSSQPRFLRDSIVWINGLGVLALIATGFWALWRRDAELIATFALALGAFAFYSLFSHYIRRYSDPITPFLFICLLWWLAVIVKALTQRLVNRADRPIEQACQSSY